MRYLLMFVVLFCNCTPKTGTKNEGRLLGKVVRIIDGDTFELLTKDRRTVRVRMYGIDCPERRQDYYAVCKTALGNYIFNKDVVLVVRDHDYWKRTIAEVFLNAKNINLMMVENGYAWHFRKYSSDANFRNAERKARSKRLGLWALKDPVAPWDFRSSIKR